MSITETLARGRLALALALLLGGAAIAGETLRDETRVLARTTGGTIERLTLPELALGETRAVATDSGAGALVTRTEAGVRIEVAGETFDVDLPDVDALAGAGHAIALEHDLASTRHGADGADERHVVVVKKRHAGDADASLLPLDRVDASLLALDPMADPEALLAQAGEGKRVVVMRRVVREHVDTN